MNSKKQTFLYLVFDLLSAAVAWTLFFIFRKLYIESHLFGIRVPLEFSQRFFLGLAFVPLFWIFLYSLSGFYRKLFRRSLLHEFGRSFLVSLTGVVIIFFSLILDDIVGNYRNYYLSFAVLFALHFILSTIPRSLITALTNRKIRNKKIGYRTLLIGGSREALELYLELSRPGNLSGNLFRGFLSLPGEMPGELLGHIPQLGEIDQLEQVMEEQKIEEVIIALGSPEPHRLEEVLNRLEEYDVPVRLLPDLFDILTGKVRMRSLFDVPLVEISRDLLPPWQLSFKRAMDIGVSLLSLLILLPVILVLALLIRLDSRGPILYSHERRGRFGKPFRLYKFRSMVLYAEENGPRLSFPDDPRITPVGRFMRRTRLDEIPNFYNVLVGDMSLVGPRPERQFFIEQIIEKAPVYRHLQKIKPGITSLGQVKFGYAENVDQMIQRMKYDLIYMENMSLYMDLKILGYTLLTILRGKGV